MEKTEWYPGWIRPARPGLYECDWELPWSYWNGKSWGRLGLTKGVAIYLASHARMNQDIPWRGLASPQVE